MESRAPRILLFDVETTPMLGFVWGKYEQNVVKFTQYSQLLCFAWKWLGEKEVYATGQIDETGYRPGKLDDKKLTKRLWELFDKADIVVAHNGDNFDCRVANARFLFHGLTPPSSYATIDTKKVAKSVGMFPSNKLGELSPFLGGEDKMETGGFGLWEGCMAGDKSSWKKMMEYNKQDVKVLEDLYLKLRPWMKRHPNFNVYNGTKLNCRACGSVNTMNRGRHYSATSISQRYQCKDCGHYSTGPAINQKVLLR